ncbi:MAG TPA: glycosyltransferase [Solirubrobacteraceae bacterium]|jgi:tetratricopeptide (TPR) repeat protein|nr:glycosyltransferase [Solirubrobacteraceae bacterium]
MSGPDSPTEYRAVRRRWEQALAASGPGRAAARDDAAAAVLAYLEREPAEPLLLNVLGVLLHEAGRSDLAVPLFGAALELDPALPAAEANLAAARAAGVAPQDDTLAARVAAVVGRARPATGLTLSVCLIVRDEEQRLEACLRGVAPAADEIVVVDTGSTDRTTDIARRFGARLLHVPWNDSFSEPRNVALAAARGDWVLFPDADEHFEPAAAPALRGLLGRTWRAGFLFPMTSRTGDGSTATVHPALRLWRNRPDVRYAGRVHESVLGSLPVDLPERFELVDVPIVHHGYVERTIAEKDKARRNLTLLALEPPGPETSFNLGSEHLRLGDWERAAEHLDAAWLAICGRPDWAGAGFGSLLALRTARARRELGRLQAARDLLRLALERYPDYTDLVYELAACAAAAGERKEAEALLEICLALGDAPPTYASTVGAGSHLAEAFLADLRRQAARTRDVPPIKSEGGRPITVGDDDARTDGRDMLDGIQPSSGDISTYGAAQRLQATEKGAVDFRLATVHGVPASPPPEVLRALDSAARVDDELRSRGLRVSFDAQHDGSVHVGVVDEGGALVGAAASPSHALDVFSGEVPLADLFA